MPEGSFRLPKPTILTGNEMLDEASRLLRAEKEAKRGIFRDEKGGIIRTEEWKKERVKRLEHKLELTKQRLNQTENEEKKIILQGRIEAIEKELENLK